MKYQLDLAHSQIQFTVRHMMIAKVRGTFDRFNGEFNLDEANPANSEIRVEIEAASINTREANRDAHLRSADFLDAEKYPQLTFVGRRVELLDTQHARLVGDLTIREITREAALDVEYLGKAKSPWGTISHGFAAQAVINRKDWDLTWNQALETGGVLVGDDITIDIELELVEVAETEEVAQAGD